MIAAAWPTTTCDIPGFDFQPSFRAKPPPAISITHQEAWQGIVEITAPCSTCWECRCGATQNLTKWCNERDTIIKDKDSQLHAATALLGAQEATIAAHWDMGTREVFSKIRQLKSTVASLETKLQTVSSELEDLKHENGILKTQLQQLHEQSQTLHQVREEKDQLSAQLISLKELKTAVPLHRAKPRFR